MANANLENLVDDISKLTLLEAADIVKMLEEKLGVSAAAPMAMMPMMGAGAAAAPVEEKTEFEVILKSVPADKKIQVIKAAREVTGLGLKEAKDLVESAPKTVKEAVSKEEADKIKQKFEEAGATVEVK